MATSLAALNGSITILWKVKVKVRLTHAVIQSMQLLLTIQDKGWFRVPRMPGRMKPCGCAVDTVSLFMGGSIPSSETSGSPSSQNTLIEQSGLTSHYNKIVKYLSRLYGICVLRI